MADSKINFLPKAGLNIMFRGQYQPGKRRRHAKGDNWNCKCVNCGASFPNRMSLRKHFVQCDKYDDIQILDQELECRSIETIINEAEREYERENEQSACVSAPAALQDVKLETQEVAVEDGQIRSRKERREDDASKYRMKDLYRSSPENVDTCSNTGQNVIGYIDCTKTQDKQCSNAESSTVKGEKRKCITERDASELESCRKSAKLTTFSSNPSIVKLEPRDVTNLTASEADSEQKVDTTVVAKPKNQKQAVYSCDYCNLKFRWMNRLQRHLLKDHPNIPGVDIKNNPRPIFSCKYCKLKFKFLSYLHRHVKSDHPDVKDSSKMSIELPGGRFRCTICMENLTSDSKLLEHLNGHRESAETLAKTTSEPQVQCQGTLDGRKLKENGMRNRKDSTKTTISLSENSDVFSSYAKSVVQHLRNNLICLQNSPITSLTPKSPQPFKGIGRSPESSLFKQRYINNTHPVKFSPNNYTLQNKLLEQPLLEYSETNTPVTETSDKMAVQKNIDNEAASTDEKYLDAAFSVSLFSPETRRIDLMSSKAGTHKEQYSNHVRCVQEMTSQYRQYACANQNEDMPLDLSSGSKRVADEALDLSRKSSVSEKSEVSLYIDAMADVLSPDQQQRNVLKTFCFGAQ